MEYGNIHVQTINKGTFHVLQINVLFINHVLVIFIIARYYFQKETEKVHCQFH